MGSSGVLFTDVLLSDLDSRISCDSVPCEPPEASFEAYAREGIANNNAAATITAAIRAATGPRRVAAGTAAEVLALASSICSLFMQSCIVFLFLTRGPGSRSFPRT